VEVQIDQHARERMTERGASLQEVTLTIEAGERFPAKFGRAGFRRNFAFDGEWRGRRYATKQVEVFAIEEDERWVVVTVLVKFF
jgi:hypothetical protein